MNKRIRVLFLTDILRGWGGTEKHLYKLISGIDKNRFECFVCTFASVEKVLDAFKKAGATTLPLHLKRIYGIRAIKQASRLAKFIRQNRIDIVHTFHFAADFFGSLVARAAHVPVVISGKRDMGFLNTALQNRALRLIQPLVDKAICVSSAVTNALASQKLINQDTSTVIYNGVDLAEFSVGYRGLAHKRAELGLPFEAPVITMVANPRIIKDVGTFVVAARKVLDAKHDAYFMIVGRFHHLPGKSPYQEKIEGLIAQLKLNGRIIFPGQCSNVNELLAVSDVCVLTSLSEGFSNTLLEYMASAKPVIVTDVGGNREAVVDGETGFLVPPKDPDRIAQHILSLLEDKDLASRMGRAGRKRIEEFFSINTMIENYQSLYAKLLSGASGEKPDQRRSLESSNSPASSAEVSRAEAT